MEDIRIPDLFKKVNELITKVEELYRLINRSTLKEDMQTAIAGKIISEITKEIKNCNCNKEILEAIRNIPSTSNEQTYGPLVERPKASTSTLKYSFPNFDVGNEELGSSGNPKALTWPFGS